MNDLASGSKHVPVVEACKTHGGRAEPVNAITEFRGRLGDSLLEIDRSNFVRCKDEIGQSNLTPGAVCSTGVTVNCLPARLFLLSSSVFQPGSSPQYDADA